jgi:hypothetical protein
MQHAPEARSSEDGSHAAVGTLPLCGLTTALDGRTCTGNLYPCMASHISTHCKKKQFRAGCTQVCPLGPRASGPLVMVYVLLHVQLSLSARGRCGACGLGLGGLLGTPGCDG